MVYMLSVYITQKKTADILGLTEHVLTTQVGFDLLPRTYMEKKYKYKMSDISNFRNSPAYAQFVERSPTSEGS